MDEYQLQGLKNLLELWKKEYPFTEEHITIIDQLIFWVSNLIDGVKK